MEILNTEIFWIGIAFVCVVALIIFKFPNAILSDSYNRIGRIVAEIAEAESLREEAEKVLLEYEQKHKDIKEDVANIVEVAHSEAQNVVKKIENDTHELINVMRKRAQDSIDRAKNEAAETIKSQAIHNSTETASVILSAYHKDNVSTDVKKWS